MNESKLALGLRDRAIAHGGDALLLDAAADIERLTAQRDTLLEKLRLIDKEFKKYGRHHWPEAVKARAAIKAVEEGK